MTNVTAAREAIARVKSFGVREFVVCGGSRNAPLVAAVADAKTYTFIDERSAAFFALGRIKRDDVPVAVITTSGTAVAELLPAAIEAFYSGLPLVLITADRPHRFRGTGAPQTIDQIGIFSAYAASDPAKWNREMPLHINIEFDEPLIDE
jgi:2-succinyl-5-enolpyruvyl-6-hydroxy-3-cyclohexene-1-carboxylate synthase